MLNIKRKVIRQVSEILYDYSTYREREREGEKEGNDPPSS
jgi:hypothetical protein